MTHFRLITASAAPAWAICRGAERRTSPAPDSRASCGVESCCRRRTSQSRGPWPRRRSGRSRGHLYGWGGRRKAAGEVRDQLLTMSERVLEAASEDLVLANGHVQVRGAPSRKVSLGALAALPRKMGSDFAPVHGFGPVAPADLAPIAAVHVVRAKVDRETAEIKSPSPGSCRSRMLAEPSRLRAADY